MNKELSTEVLIVGGGTGGCGAALSLCAMGKKVIMTEPTAWIGGQLTSQAVPPDENFWVEDFGATRSYRTYRRKVREYYQQNYPLTADARGRWNLNPGDGDVSLLCHEFRVAEAVLQSMLAAYRSSGLLRILHGFEPVSADVEGDAVKSVTVQNQSGVKISIAAKYFLDATELGDLLPMTKTEYVTGFESKAMTGEPSAKEKYEPLNMQPISWCFALDYVEGENHVIEKPASYDFWKNYIPPVKPAWSGKLVAWEAPMPWTLKTVKRQFEPHDVALKSSMNLWHFRRIANRENFENGFYKSDIVLVNWPQIDYLPGPICEVSPEEKERHLKGSRELSLSMLYWMQTEAPYANGKTGLPGLRLRSDVTNDGPDGLAMAPYVRESRRIQALTTVLEQHVDLKIRGDHGAEQFPDSVGIGHYNIDLHPSTGGDNYIDVRACPFQIPLKSLIPKRMTNLLAACKNLGVTHITNGCYRLHPVEWNIGEAAGLLAAWCIDQNETPHSVAGNTEKTTEFQKLARKQGIRTEWPRVYSKVV